MMNKQEFMDTLKEEKIPFEDHGDWITIDGYMVWIEHSNGIKFACITVEDKIGKNGFYTTNQQTPAWMLLRKDLQPMIDKYRKCHGISQK